MDENGYIVEPEELDQEPKSSFFLMITYDVLADNRLSDFQKLLYGSITGLCRENGYCWASNAYFEKLFNKSTDTIIKGISKLVELNYLKRELVYKKKVSKNGKKVETKQVAFRKLFVVIDKSNNTTGSIKNHTTGSMENNTEIDNPIIDNLTFINSKEFNEGVHENGTLNAEGNLDNNLEELGKKIGTEGIEVFSKDEEVKVPTHGADEQPQGFKGGKIPPDKQKGGLGPLYDMILIQFPSSLYPTVNAGLKEYLRRHIGVRKLPTQTKWKEMLDKIYMMGAVELPGTRGFKFIESKVIPILEKAIEGKNGVPYPDFDNLNGELMEPAVKENRVMNKGY